MSLTVPATLQAVNRLIQDLEGLRGSVSGRGPRQAHRIDSMLARARALQAGPQGSDHEATLRGCINQLTRLRAAVHGPERPSRLVRAAG